MIRSAAVANPRDATPDAGASSRRRLRPNAHTTVATYCLLILAGSVSFIMPDSIDVPTPTVRPAIPAPRPGAAQSIETPTPIDDANIASLARREP